MPQQIELFKIDSPCIGVCQSNKKGYCFGCLRSRPERQLWLKMTEEQKKEVLRLIIGRKKRLEQLRSRQRQQMSLDFDASRQIDELF